MTTEVEIPMPAPTTMTTTANVDTSPPSVPPVREPARRSRGNTGKLWMALAVSGGLLLTAIVGSGLIEVPYYSFKPGSAFETEGLVEVGAGQPTYDSAGEILFLTVRVGPITALEGFAGWVSGDIDVIPEQGILQGRSEEENRARQAAAMVGSQNTAIVVAFNLLGLPLDPTGTGAVVLEVTPGSPADGALEVADTIVGVNGAAIRLNSELGQAIGSFAPGSAVTLDVVGLDGATRQVPVTLVARPDDATRGFLGVASDTRDFDPRPSIPVTIHPGQVGGPSAGLAFTLAMLDVLTPGDLTGGQRIAVTGAIAADGTVLPVGGVSQKTVAAARAGATVLLVPSGEESEALAHPHGLRVIPVGNIGDALAVLQELGGEPLPPPGQTAVGGA